GTMTAHAKLRWHSSPRCPLKRQMRCSRRFTTTGLRTIMKRWLLALPLTLLIAAPSSAQSRTWTNADLGKPLSTARPIPSPDELRGLLANAYTLPEPLPEGPAVFILSSGGSDILPRNPPTAPLSSQPFLHVGYIPWYDRSWFRAPSLYPPVVVNERIRQPRHPIR